jgi:hypothetical protein
MPRELSAGRARRASIVPDPVRRSLPSAELDGRGDRSTGIASWRLLVSELRGLSAGRDLRASLVPDCVRRSPPLAELERRGVASTGIGSRFPVSAGRARRASIVPDGVRRSPARTGSPRSAPLVLATRRLRVGSDWAATSRSSVRRSGDAVSASVKRLGGAYTVFTALPKVYRRSRKSALVTDAPRNRYGL